MIHGFPTALPPLTGPSPVGVHEQSGSLPPAKSGSRFAGGEGASEQLTTAKKPAPDQPPYANSSLRFAGGGGAQAREPAVTLGPFTNFEDFAQKLPKLIKDSNQEVQDTPPTSRKWPNICILTGLGAFGVSFLSKASIGKSISLGLLAGGTLFSVLRGSQKYFSTISSKPEKQPFDVFEIPTQQGGNARFECGKKIVGGASFPVPRERIEGGSTSFFYSQEDITEFNIESGYAILRDESSKAAFEKILHTPGRTLEDLIAHSCTLLFYCHHCPVTFDINQAFSSRTELQKAFNKALETRNTHIQSVLESFGQTLKIK
ncbi:MAG: hypothetical protein FJZ61_03990 [Chlamydiae bacterium]|nr:hypothetical protein [Chlamydiota bacterium]